MLISHTIETCSQKYLRESVETTEEEIRLRPDADILIDMCIDTHQRCNTMRQMMSLDGTLDDIVYDIFWKVRRANQKLRKMKL